MCVYVHVCVRVCVYVCVYVCAWHDYFIEILTVPSDFSPCVN